MAVSAWATPGCAMGMAATGRRAVADTMLVDLMFEATSALVEQASKLRCIGLSGGATSVPMVMRARHGNARSRERAAPRRGVLPNLRALPRLYCGGAGLRRRR